MGVSSGRRESGRELTWVQRNMTKDPEKLAQLLVFLLFIAWMCWVVKTAVECDRHPDAPQCEENEFQIKYGGV